MIFYGFLQCIIEGEKHVPQLIAVGADLQECFIVPGFCLFFFFLAARRSQMN
jgi:hypothetical protein